MRVKILGRYNASCPITHKSKSSAMRCAVRAAVGNRDKDIHVVPVRGKGYSVHMHRKVVR